MILVADTMFSDAQELGGTAGTTASTNVVDVGYGATVFRNYDPVRTVIAVVNKAPAGTTISGYTVNAKIQGSNDNSSWTDIAATGAIGGDALVAGKFLFEGYKLDKNEYRYIRIAFTEAVAEGSVVSTKPKITAWIGVDDAPATKLAY